MKRFNLVLAAAAAATLTLSACDITITGPPAGPPPPDVTRPAGTDPDSAAWSGTVTRGDSVIFELDVPASVSSGYDVLYLELDNNLQLELRDPNTYNVVASSSSPSYFAKGMAGLSIAAAGELGAQAIGLLTECRGSCIIIRAPSAKTFYARVVNTTGTSLSTDLYFYGDVEQDTGEPNDQVSSTGIPLSAVPFDVYAPSGEQGAIELLGDVDYYSVSQPRNVVFRTVVGNPVDLRVAILKIVYVDGVPTARVVGNPFGQDEVFNVFAGEYLKVYSLSGRAGASASSRYTLLGQP